VVVRGGQLIAGGAVTASAAWRGVGGSPSIVLTRYIGWLAGQWPQPVSPLITHRSPRTCIHKISARCHGYTHAASSG